jgi:hypothetical protein
MDLQNTVDLKLSVQFKFIFTLEVCLLCAMHLMILFLSQIFLLFNVEGFKYAPMGKNSFYIIGQLLKKQSIFLASFLASLRLKNSLQYQI